MIADIFKNGILEYLRLFRMHAGAMEATIVLIGALLMGQRNFPSLSIIFLIGLSGHICGYVLNDYTDIEIDRRSSELREKPLVSGVIPKQHALIVAFLAGSGTYALTLVFFPSIPSILLLSSAAILAVIYDFFGKRFPGLSDFIVAGAIFSLLLFGASTVSTHFTGLVYIVGGSLFFDVAFINVVEGGLKDAAHDFISGAKTLAEALGVRVREGRLLITNRFKAFAYGVKATSIGLILLLGFQPEINLWFSDEYLIHIIVFLLTIVIVIFSHKFLSLSIFDRSQMKQLYSGLNAASGALTLIMLLPFLGLQITLVLILIPITWYTVFNLILYGKPLQPRV